jgi:PAS domain S-box-containing protein
VNILLVDDHPANLLALRAILDSLGHNLVEARSGEEALRRLADDDFAVVLLDVRMEGLDGFETARRIRGGERSRHTPIIFITAVESDEAVLVQAYALGAVDYLVKPLVPEILRAKVAAFVELLELRRRAERQAEQLRLLIEGTKDYAIILLDAEGQVASWNPGAERIKGYQADEIIGQHFSRFYPPEAVERGWPAEELRRAAAEGRFEDEGWRLRKDGSRFWANVVITALYDDAGGLRGFSKITRDMTERKQAEENARRLLQEQAARQLAEAAAREARRAEAVEREHRERLRVTLASIGDAVIVTDMDGRVTFMNPVAQALTGYEPREAVGRPLDEVFAIVNEETRKPAENPATRALREGVVVGLANHTVLLARDGTERPIDDSAAPIRGADRTVAGVVLVFRDVTEQRRAKQEDQKNKEVLQLVHKIGKIGHWEWDALTDENRWSPEIEALYGLPPGGFEGGLQGWAKLLHPDDLPRAEADVRRALQTGDYFSEFRVIWPDGSVHWLETRAKVFKDDHGKQARIVGVNMDVTERKRVEEELRRSQQELQERIEQLAEADRHKDEFLAMLAHELRNPLAPLRNALQILKMSGVNGDTAERARQMADRQVHQLVRLVDDLLDVSRIMRGRIELRKEPVELSAVVARAVETAQPALDTQGQELAVVLPAEPVRVEADPARLAQALANLLQNAAKYSERAGRIWLEAEREGGEAVLRVRDAGIGIRPDLLPHVFDLFVQGDSSLERARGGLGIGLTVVRKLVEMHGGSVSAHSEGPGRGSEFVVRLPALEVAPRPPEQREGAPSPRAAAARRVLVVDDNVDAADSVAMLLRFWGHDVRLAYNGPQALEVAGRFQPELVVLDIGLPGMNGYEVARRLRQQPRFRKTVLAALTGYGQEEDRRRSADAGFDRHMTKPVDPEELRQLVAEAESESEIGVN